MTIYPRPSTSQKYVAKLADAAPILSVDILRDRPARHCRCGTKLRRSKPLWDVLCDACDQKRAASVPVEELHPETSYERQKHRPSGRGRVEYGPGPHQGPAQEATSKPHPGGDP